jgi:site-specific DNA-methyltransferase (cytosine-N4-specific)
MQPLGAVSMGVRVGQLEQDIPEVSESYKTQRGRMLVGKIEHFLASSEATALKGKVKLILTSPPFPLITKKKYGNSTGKEYLAWLADLAPKLSDLLTDDGSIVLEIGNAWEPGLPAMSTLPLEALLEFKKAAGLFLCQQMICHNPARLPTPAAWVNIRRIRLKDSYTHVWWMSRTAYPDADNRRVVVPYSKTMKGLLKSGKYNAGRRPSGHVISDAGFLIDHGGSIAANVLDFESDRGVPNSLMKFSNTAWDAEYRNYCEANNLEAHPARMQTDLAAFFIQFLTEPRNLVFDPFGGSNTTGAVAERMKRRWVSIEANKDYASGSKGRFPQE